MSAEATTREELEELTIEMALLILERRLKNRGTSFNLDAVKSFLRLHARGLEHEVFAVMYLDAQNRLIGYEQLFRGTLTHATVYPREVVKAALAKNAASVILHHNHPSECCTPSEADRDLTNQLRQALNLVEIRVLDHFITSDGEAFSMAEETASPGSAL